MSDEQPEASDEHLIDPSRGPEHFARRRWTLTRLERLDPQEHDFQEFKSSAWLAIDEELHPEFLFALSKQVSAFVNGGGGILVIGMQDHGLLDHGVLTHLKGGTREWLEDVVSSSISPPLKGFNVFEVPLSYAGEMATRAAYVIDLPTSPEAPHQARDHRYYLRVAGKSRPMGHLHLEDVIRRNSIPKVNLSRLGPYGELEYDVHKTMGPRVFLMLRGFLLNEGRVMARHVGVELTLPRPFVDREVRERMVAMGETHYTQRPGDVSFFRYNPTPLFPTQEVYALCIWLCLDLSNLSIARSDAVLRWSVYADDAQPLTGEVPLDSFSSIRQAVEWLEEYNE